MGGQHPADQVGRGRPRPRFSLAESNDRGGSGGGAQMAKLTNGKHTDAAKAASPVLSQSAAAKVFEVSRCAVQSARTVLERGTPAEVAAADEGRLALRAAADAIRAGVPPAERAKARLAPKRDGEKRAKAAIWGQLRGGLTSLSGLPAATEVEKIGPVRVPGRRLEPSPAPPRGCGDMGRGRRAGVCAARGILAGPGRAGRAFDHAGGQGARDHAAKRGSRRKLRRALAARGRAGGP